MKKGRQQSPLLPTIPVPRSFLAPLALACCTPLSASEELFLPSTARSGGLDTQDPFPLAGCVWGAPRSSMTAVVHLIIIYHWQYCYRAIHETNKLFEEQFTAEVKAHFSVKGSDGLARLRWIRRYQSALPSQSQIRLERLGIGQVLGSIVLLTHVAMEGTNTPTPWKTTAPSSDRPQKMWITLQLLGGHSSLCKHRQY